MAATFLDRLILSVSNPDASAQADAQDANDAQLKRKWEEILNRKDLTPVQRLNAEREYAKLGGVIDNWDTIANGATETFGTAYLETAKKTANEITSGITDAIPWKVWLFAGFVAFVFLWFKFGGKN